jgi:hypothetical protein
MEYEGMPPEMPQMEPAFWAAMGAYWLFWLIVYIWMAICLMNIAKKTNTPNAWLAWIPFANLYLMCVIAGKPGWWLILLLIPFLNIIIGIIVWMGIAKARGKPDWIGILMIIPFVNLIIPGYLAFSK